MRTTPDKRNIDIILTCQRLFECSETDFASFTSLQVNNATAAGDGTRAEDASRKAKLFNIIGLVTGIIFIIIVIIIYAIQISNISKIHSKYT